MHHLRRNAYLYVRQSTLRQVMENTESTERQYALRQRAIQLGWSQEQVVIIDNDMGQSGASAADRAGFQLLVAEVSLGRVGIVMGLEVSRLARNSADWHRLLEICALTGTLILDEDGLYDPAHFNDRLLLGLKGTMSEAELHVLKARLQGGILNKARRGELVTPFHNVTGLVTELVECREEKRLQRLQKQLQRFHLIVLDELGYVPFSKAGAELLFEVISRATVRKGVAMMHYCDHSFKVIGKGIIKGFILICWFRLKLLHLFP